MYPMRDIPIVFYENIIDAYLPPVYDTPYGNHRINHSSAQSC